MTISIPFKQKAPQKSEPPKPKLYKTLFDGHIKIFHLDGLYELWLDEEQILPKATLEQIENRIRSLSEPKVDTPNMERVSDSVDISDSVHNCPSCRKEVSDLRQKLLGTPNCGWCTPQAGALYGVMEYNGKQAGVLVVTSSRKEFLQLKKAANHRR